MNQFQDQNLENVKMSEQQKQKINTQFNYNTNWTFDPDNPPFVP